LPTAVFTDELDLVAANLNVRARVASADWLRTNTDPAPGDDSLSA
jgi:hypothetical protein